MIVCLRIGFVASFIFFANGAKEKCEKCLPAEKCKFYGNLKADEQESWVERFECPKPSKHERHLYGFAPRAKGDVVCCPDNIWGTNSKNDNHASANRNDDTKNDNTRYDKQSDFNPFGYDYNNPYNNNYDQQNNGYGNPEQNYDFNNGDSNGGSNGGGTDFGGSDYGQTSNPWGSKPNEPQDNGNQGYYRNQNGYPGRNMNQGTNRNDQGFGGNYNPYNRNNDYFGEPNMGGQCRVSSFPPNPNTGCCGLEATADESSGSEYAPNRPPPRNLRPSWMPRQRPSFSAPMSSPWSSSWNPMDDFQGYMPRFKRSPKVNVTIGNRIAGGKETELEQYPWTVLLQTTFDYGTKESTFNCGGSIISSRYILTAAHCIVEEGARVKDVEIYLAEYDKRTFPRDCKNVLGEGQKCVDNIVMHGERVIPHPNYDETKLTNDIGLIRLRGTAPYTNYIRPICLPPINVDHPDFFNLRLAVAGWGRNGRYKSEIKQSTIVNLVPNSDCKKYYPNLSKAHLCAAGYSGEDTCKGDSGGPLMILYEEKYYVSGVVSGKRADAPCGTSVPSLYTNVYEFLPWIRSKIRN